MSDKLTDAIRVIIDEAQRLRINDFEDAIDRASDDLSTGERADDLFIDSVLDGIRWGVRAAACVERGGGTILRVRAPGGVGITHEWRGSSLSAIGRASIMQTVMEAIGKNGAGEEVTDLVEQPDS